MPSIKKTGRITILAALIGISLWASPFHALAASDSPKFDHNHTLFDSVLQKHAKYGLVDYKALTIDRSDLLKYLEQIAGIDWNDYETWSRQQKLALWINAYNALTIEVIVRNYPIGKPDLLSYYPVNSIRHIEGVWDKLKWKVAGKMFTLDHIEHVILRKEIKEPRIHFVLVCASIGCPWLESSALTADTVEVRLDQAAYNYINRQYRVKVDVENNVVWFPMIFDWFGEDFKEGYKDSGLFAGRSPAERGLLYFIYKFLPTKQKLMLIKNEFTIKYITFDWGLNELLTRQ